MDFIFHAILISFFSSEKLTRRLIYATEKPFHILVVKDLTPDGFSAPRQPPEELDDVKLIVQRLAQFHAASFHLSETVSL